VGELFEKLRVTEKRKMEWFKVWEKIDVDMSRTMEYDEFIAYFDLQPDVRISELWCKRVFELFNPDFNGVIRFPDFIRTLFEICVYDEHLTHKFAFRLLSRCGATINMQFDVINETDVFDFAVARYGIKDVPNSMLKPVSLKIFGSLDDDHSGGVSFSEFVSYSKTNRIFLLLGHQLQEILREKVFGKEYWMKESRERADEYILSFDLASELDIALAEDMEPYDWNEDFTEMVFESKKRGAHAKKLRQERDIYLYEKSRANYAKMSGFLRRMGMKTTSMRGAFLLWKRNIEYIREELGEAAPGFTTGERTGARGGIRLDTQEALSLQMSVIEGPKMPSIHELIVQETSKPVEDLDELIHNFESKYVNMIDPLNSTNAMNLNPADVEIDYVPPSGSALSRASTRQGTAPPSAPMARIDEPARDWPSSGPETPATGRSEARGSQPDSARGSAPGTGRSGGGSFFGAEGSLSRMISAKLSGRRPGSSGSRPGTGGSQLGSAMGSARSHATSDGSATDRSGTESEFSSRATSRDGGSRVGSRQGASRPGSSGGMFSLASFGNMLEGVRPGSKQGGSRPGSKQGGGRPRSRSEVLPTHTAGSGQRRPHGRDAINHLIAAQNLLHDAEKRDAAAAGGGSRPGSGRSVSMSVSAPSSRGASREERRARSRSSRGASVVASMDFSTFGGAAVAPAVPTNQEFV